MRGRSDGRPRAILLTVLAIAGGGAAVQHLPARFGGALPDDASGTSERSARPLRPVHDPDGVLDDDEEALKRRFRRAVEQLRSGRHAEAERALQHVLERAPHLPEAHVNLGFTRLGLGRVEQAIRSFSFAIELRPEQSNAYFGLADALEQSGDLHGALGAMRTYVHLSSPENPYLPRARAALWEWRTRLAAESG